MITYTGAAIFHASSVFMRTRTAIDETSGRSDRASVWRRTARVVTCPYCENHEDRRKNCGPCRQKGQMRIFPQAGKNTQDPPYRGNNGHLIGGLLEGGKVLAAVDRQEPDVAAWLWYCYGAFWRRHQESRVWARVYTDLFSGTPPERAGRYMRLTRIAVANYKFSLWNDRPFRATDMAIALDVSAKNWDRDWAPKLRKVDSLLYRLDSEGQAGVRGVVDELRERVA